MGALGSAAAALATAAALLSGCSPGPERERAEPPRRTAGPANPGQPSFFVVLIDTLRRDHLRAYGYERETAPRITALAGESVVFDRCVTVCPWTNPAIASLFSGRYPQAVFPAAPHEFAVNQALPDELDLLAERLQRAGYRTLAFIDHPGINRWLQFHQGFDEFTVLPPGWRKWAGSEQARVVDEVRRQLDTTGEQPFYFYVHLIYPHEPYRPPPPHAGHFGPGFEQVRRREKDGIVNRYDEEILYTDQVVGSMLDELQARGLVDSTYIVIVSDHGEAFWEHDLQGHGNSFFEELLAVPLVVRPPGGRRGEPARIADPVSFVDVPATILDLAGIAAADDDDGTSLAPYLVPGRERARRDGPLFSENAHSAVISGLAAQDGRYKLVYAMREPLHDEAVLREDVAAGRNMLLFDLQDDPGELKPLPYDHAGAGPRLGQAMLAHWQRNQAFRKTLSPTEAKMSPEAKERLHTLGYVQ
ncbi:MAG: sulfatase [Acidobacteria bacterium]|nr:sulfatase [Acidobacteriota bacterium]